MKKPILIQSVPRSGSSWLGQIFNSVPSVAFRFQPFFSYAFKDALNLQSTKEEIDQVLADLEATDDAFVLQKDKVLSGSYPSFEKENARYVVLKNVRYHHLLPHLFQIHPDLKAVGIVRHPCATLNSWLQAPKEFSKEWLELEEWRFAHKKNLHRPEEFNGFEKWKEATSIFMQLKTLYPDRFYLLRYSDLNKDTAGIVQELFQFFDLPLSTQTIDFITQSKQKSIADIYSVYREKNDDMKWVAQLHPAIATTIQEELKGSDFEHFLY